MKKAKKILMTVLCAVLLVCISVGATLAYLADTTDIVTNTFTVGDVSFVDPTGKLAGGLDEVKSNDLGVADETVNRVIENKYKLMPGITYAKDPTIHLDPTSEPCYVRVKVTVTNYEDIAAVVKKLNPGVELTKEQIAAKMTDVVVGYDTNVWEDKAHAITFAPNAEDATKFDSVTYEFRVKAMVVPGDKKTYNGTAVVKTAESLSMYTNGNTDTTFDINFFDQIQIPGDLEDEDLVTLESMKIEIVAHAIQAEGFKDTVAEDGTVTKTAMQNAWEAFDAQ